MTECGFENRPADQIVSDLEGCPPHRGIYLKEFAEINNPTKWKLPGE